MYFFIFDHDVSIVHVFLNEFSQSMFRAFESHRIRKQFEHKKYILILHISNLVDSGIPIRVYEVEQLIGTPLFTFMVGVSIITV